MSDRSEASSAQESMNPFLAAPHSRKMMTLVGIYLAVVANLMVSTTNATLLPAAAQEIGGADIYGLAQGISGILSVCIMPIYGVIGARNPAIKRFLCGGSLIIGALVLLVRGLAPSMMVIIVANVFWGLVSAGVFVIGFTMIRDVFEKDKAGVYLGLVGTMMSLGMLIGPFVGGIFIDRIGWRIFCFMMFAFLCLGGLLVINGVKVKKADVESLAVGTGKIDKTGAVLLTVFLGTFIIALSMGDKWIPFGSPLSNALIVVAIIALLLLIVSIKKKGDGAIVPASALKDRNTLVFSGVNFLYNFGAMSLTFFVPGFIMTVLGGDVLVGVLGGALAAGLALSIRAIPGLFLSPIFGKAIARRDDSKGVLMIGNAFRIVVALGLFLFLQPGVPVLVIYILMLLAGVFTSQHSVTMSAGPQIQLRPNLRTTGNSVIQLSQNLGGSVGTALFTYLMSIDAIMGMTWCLLATLIAWVLLTAISFLLKKAPDKMAQSE